MNLERKWNVPNLLSAYRIVALPFIVWTIIAGNKDAYILLLSMNLVTDILDGVIARAFRLETEFGARLDSLADVGTYIMAFAGMIVLENAFVTTHQTAFFILMGLYVSVQLIALIRFQRTTSFHLYSSKATGYAQGIFMFTYFVVGYSSRYFYGMIALSLFAYLEALVIVVLIPELRSNVKGIYFMLKTHNRIC